MWRGCTRRVPAAAAKGSGGRGVSVHRYNFPGIPFVGKRLGCFGSLALSLLSAPFDFLSLMLSVVSRASHEDEARLPTLYTQRKDAERGFQEPQAKVVKKNRGPPTPNGLQRKGTAVDRQYHVRYRVRRLPQAPRGYPGLFT